ncbi:MAG: hypothetical protein DRP87_15280 [Spirochaetes bacterium]|nr:MAG: hypothetical protein DRP87_15280 [Spirochaetota bacterium]
MKVLLSKFIESEEQDLKYIKDSHIQLAFFRRKTFRDFDHEDFKSRLDSANIKVESVHAPAADIYHSANDEFLNMLKTIKQVYNVKVVTLHPQRGDRRQARVQYKKVEQEIQRLGLILAYETFEGEDANRKWIAQLHDMHHYFRILDLPFLGITYDLAHSSMGKCLKEIRKYSNNIKVIHFSDALPEMIPESEEHHQHLPIGMGRYPTLDFIDTLIEIDYKGFLVLEYMDKYEHLLRGDAELVKRYINEEKEPLRALVNSRKKISQAG